MRHEDELRKLAERLPEVPQEKFLMSLWGHDDRYASGCGFAGCAIGWFAHLVPGQKLIAPSTISSLNNYIPITRVTYAGREGGELVMGFPAIDAYFDIPPAISFWLFSKNSYPKPGSITPQDVSRRIFSYLNGERP